MAWITLGQILAATPASALAIGRKSSVVLSNRAIELLAQPGDAKATRTGRAMAEQALLQEPSNPRAALAVALAADAEGNTIKRSALLTYSESLSRRELLTQLGLIESQVAAGNVATALLHYHRALTTSKQAESLLLPTLASASAEPAVAGPLARMLAERPLWWRQFVEQLSASGMAPLQMRQLVQALRLDAKDAVDRQLLSGVLGRMVAIGGYRDAAQLYAATPGRPVAEPGTSVSFDNPHAVFPFDWQIIEGADFGGYLETEPSGRTALALRANDGASGVAARRLVLLAPGSSYAVRVSYGGVDDNPLAGPSMALRCANSQQAFRTFRLPPAAAGGRVIRFDGTVPSGCAAQWLELDIRGSASQSEPGWIGAVQLNPTVKP